jgi:hypothetical protein
MDIKTLTLFMHATKCETRCPWNDDQYTHGCKYLGATATACPDYTNAAIPESKTCPATVTRPKRSQARARRSA